MIADRRPRGGSIAAQAPLELAGELIAPAPTTVYLVRPEFYTADRA
jgi:hypothetical protein